ncbi:MAG: hypothetical protein ACOY0T_32250 [Myxococcota bacterium]
MTKLFHCIVVLGAAVGACGGKQESNQPEVGGQGSGGAQASGGGTGAGGSGACGGSSAITIWNCGRPRTACDDPNVVINASDCNAPQQYDCNSGKCVCNENAPVVPTDCAHTAQFNCASHSPECACYCDVDAPLDPASCRTGAWECTSYDPPVGCYCQVVIL